MGVSLLRWMIITAQEIALKALGVLENFGLAVLSIKQRIMSTFRCSKRAKTGDLKRLPAHPR